MARTTLIFRALKEDKDLFNLYRELVTTNVITAKEFWETGRAKQVTFSRASFSQRLLLDGGKKTFDVVIAEIDG